MKAGNFLIVDDPRQSDAILVLAGETDIRPRRGLELLRQGYAERMVIDVPANVKLYEFSQMELAERYVHDLQGGGLPKGAQIEVCPIEGLSTKDESKNAESCLKRDGARSVLIVTSDFHTRRALAVFRREFPRHAYSVAAARSEDHFGERWWKRRQWAKVFFDEWVRLVWWKVVDQWR
jgi:hypothetical protein